MKCQRRHQGLGQETDTGTGYIRGLRERHLRRRFMRFLLEFP